jgi:hypothetical protein
MVKLDTRENVNLLNNQFKEDVIKVIFQLNEKINAYKMQKIFIFYKCH